MHRYLLLMYSAIDAKDNSINIAEEIQKILKTLVSGEFVPDIPEPVLPGTGKKGGVRAARPSSPTKDREDTGTP